MKQPWPELAFWNSVHWESAQQKLQQEVFRHGCYLPVSGLFDNLRNVSLAECRVIIVGQDPYPQRGMATGSAFRVPQGTTREECPPTLKAILAELEQDLAFQVGSDHSLSKWEAEGCLLWNAYPTVQEGKSLSHKWDDWVYLTEEIIQKLACRGRCVFVFCGARAKAFCYPYLHDLGDCRVLTVAHPSPRAAGAVDSFRGSRIFSRINDALGEIAVEPIDWRL